MRRTACSDGMVSDPRACDFDPVAALTCKGAKTDGCLSAQQTAALKKAFAGPKDSRQNQIYPGFLWDTGITASGQGIPGLLSPGPGPLGPPNLVDGNRRGPRGVRAGGAIRRQVGDTKLWTNLNTFSGRGGKLVFYHGVSDPWFSALDTVDYYEKMSAANGGDKTCRLEPVVPRAGDGPLRGRRRRRSTRSICCRAVVDWVEKGKAPDAVRATGRAFPGRSRPLCPYPAHAHYKGAGDVEDAGSFECRP